MTKYFRQKRDGSVQDFETAEALLAANEDHETRAWWFVELGQPTPPASEPPCDSADSGRDVEKGTTR